MNKAELEKLSEKYYAGETSLAEEDILFQYYNKESYSDAFNADRAQFAYFNAARNEAPGVDFSFDPDSFPIGMKVTRQGNLWLLTRIAAALILGLGLGWFLLGAPGNLSKHRITTNSSEVTSVNLPDGSVVWLNAETELLYDNTFGQKKREIHLTGEAWFEVARDGDKPFVIHTGAVTSEVLGTSFNLRSYPHEQAIVLDVFSGKVSFGATKKVEVEQGMQAHVDPVKESSVTLQPGNPNAVAWKTRHLIFDDALMRDVIHDLERYFNISIELETPDVLNCHFKGSFQDPRLEDILKVLGYSLNIKYTMRNGKCFLSGQNCATK